ncbi:MAG TPA: hypothetical protein VGU46_08320 [Acidobacteriaceae bacterium]|nr:hypothetical protein [Acidobacteriaceae bacterium]
MSAEGIERLRSYTDRVVRMTTTSGEEMTVKILFLFDEEQDFCHDVLSTNRESEYKRPLNSAAYVTRYDDIVSFELVKER